TIPLPNCAEAVPTHKPKTSTTARTLFFIICSPFVKLPISDVPLPSQIGGDFVVGVIGNCEVAGQINLDAVALPDRDSRQNVQEFVEDALRGLAQAFANSLLNALRAGLS